MTPSIGRALRANAACTLVALCAALAAHAEDAPIDRPRCDPAGRTPRVVSTGTAALDESIWTTGRGWETKVRFRLDDAGAPSRLVVRLVGDADNSAQLESITRDTLQLYRFCLPADFSAETDWVANVQFVHRKLPSGAMFIQMFTPSYSRADVAEQREGTARAAATYGADGRPTRVHLTSSSGDRVLDDKTIATMTSNRLVFHDASTMKFPLTFDMPFRYVIR